MKKLLLILNSAVLACTVHGTTIVYDNFGPGDTYDPMFGYGIGNTNDSVLRSQAMQFTAGVSGDLATVELGLTFEDTPVPVEVFLYADASNSPTGTGTLLGMVTPTAMFQTTNNSIVSLNVAGMVPVSLGTNYWLALMPTSPLKDSWQQTLPPVAGEVATSTDDGMTWSPDLNTLAAFRITANVAGVPEPATWAVSLLVTGTILISIWRKRASGFIH